MVNRQEEENKPFEFSNLIKGTSKHIDLHPYSYISDLLRGPRHPRILVDYTQESEDFRSQISAGICAFFQQNNICFWYLTPNKEAYLYHYRSVLYEEHLYLSTKRCLFFNGKQLDNDYSNTF